LPLPYVQLAGNLRFFFQVWYFYRSHWTINETHNIYHGGKGNNAGTVCVELKGSAMETLHCELLDLLHFIKAQNGKLCRFDLAIDDTRNVLPFPEIVKLSTGETFRRRVRTKLCRPRKRDNSLTVLPEISTQPRRVAYGSERSDNYLVIYDKEYCSGIEYPFLRCELRLTNRDDLADLLENLTAPGCDVARYLCGIVRGKLEFLESGDSNKGRSKVCKWWIDFLAGASVRKLARPKKIRKDTGYETGYSEFLIFRELKKLKAKQDKEALARIYSRFDNDMEGRQLAFNEVINL